MSSWLKKSDPKEAMRSNERTLRRTSREIEGDRRQLERKEKELEFEIKKLAKQGQKEACGVLAKQLLQLRKQKAKSVNMGARMNAISAKNREIYSVGRMVNAVDKTTDTMKTMSKQLPPEKLARNLQEFVKAQERLGITDEIVSDTLDTMLEESGDEEEQDAIVSKVLDEIGIDLSVQLSKVPEVPSSTAHSADKLSDADLEKMLSELKS